MLINNQYEFKKGRSTTLACFELVKIVTICLNTRASNMCILDMKKSNKLCFTYNTIEKT